MSKLIPLEFKNQRIITTKVLAQEYGTEEGNIQKNFSRNEKRFTEGKHYYKLEGQALKNFKNSLPTESLEPIKYAPVLYLWTDRGAARHAKILDTDEAWEVYEELEDNYFNPKKHKPLDNELTTIDKVFGLLQGTNLMGAIVQAVVNVTVEQRVNNLNVLNEETKQVIIDQLEQKNIDLSNEGARIWKEFKDNQAVIDMLGGSSNQIE
ncbi:ORF6N domain-containing protein [Clostridium neonatale]|uniref:ORF6N domain-containing protein n=1 Tax=Clostridium neonatale TaxID=137838 RepID=UPI00291BB394|nr:ORF6N domain-containing protein [Clostridium neonatale]CAI3537727.1 Anti-repressor [Clostridium neonatale]CAI3606000.1 Anti-repressor [Clostridium neonatale]CAI3635452.1 Anti-repressor [Clostridium neonatale]CAI3637015.1 Anti-repressor [Clostridium neonatale]CAI3637848.1 Anti-repressor [Clostridium neonatale]